MLCLCMYTAFVLFALTVAHYDSGNTATAAPTNTTTTTWVPQPFETAAYYEKRGYAAAGPPFAKYADSEQLYATMRKPLA